MGWHRDVIMDRTVNVKCRSHFWYPLLASFLVWFVLFYVYYSAIVISKDGVVIIGNNSTDSIDSGVSNGGFHDKNNIVSKGTGKLMEKLNGGDNFEEKNESAPINFFLDGVDVDQILKLAEEQEAGNQTLLEEESGTEFASTDYGSDFSEPVESLPLKDRIGEVTREPTRGNEVRVESDTVQTVPIKERTGEVSKQPIRENEVSVESDTDTDTESCTGRYIYMHQIPRKFNVDLLRDCRLLSDWENMCVFAADFGFGPRIPSSEKVFSKSGWFQTNQFMLEVIFHNKMKHYKCLTNDSSLASAVFVPYYAGFDVVRYLWHPNRSLKDNDSLDLVKWLRQKPEWKRMWGRDHFMVAGRITWDFRRETDSLSDWGNRLLYLPETKNMTVLVIESSPWHNNDFAIPYPTYFHPSSDVEVLQWQNRMRKQKRRFLFSFAGGARNNTSNSIRNEVMNQCWASRANCKLLDCDARGKKCNKPVYVMKLFQNSIFCLEPPGDSYTRRSAFDSILAGCIPVFFHPASAYVQYIWHLPKDYAKYSVFIPSNQLKEGLSIERVLSRIPKAKVRAMREEVIRLIPNVIYADHRSRSKTFEDAFDLTINGLLQRVETSRREMIEGKNLTADFAEELSWKYNFAGTLEAHEWDPFFALKKDPNNQ